MIDKKDIETDCKAECTHRENRTEKRRHFLRYKQGWGDSH